MVMCSMCASFERHRFLYYVYDKFFFNSKEKINLLHIAPEKSVYDKIKQNPSINYVTCDIAPRNFPFAKNIEKQDCLNLTYKDETFDFIIHNHVMEHVKNDKIFLTECLRVLKKGGKMIVSIPYHPDTLCDDSKTTDEDRIKYYGQKDHVRVYGKDFYSNFKNEFNIKFINQNDYLTEAELDAIKGKCKTEDLFFEINKEIA